MDGVKHRDWDLAVIDRVNIQLPSDTSLCFVVTGSYAIEALTRTGVVHKDIDANVFTKDVLKAKVTILKLRDCQHSSRMKFILHKVTTDRIEYDVHTISENEIGSKSRLEIHILPADEIEENIVVISNPNNQRISRVGLTRGELIDSSGKACKFLVKSLAYSIATWALRISNAAQNQLRPVKLTDIVNFNLLLQQSVALTEVFMAIENHPQMPVGANAQEIYQASLSKVEKLS